MKIPFDISYHFDENLHDIPNSPVQMQQAIDFLQSKFDNSYHDVRQQIFLAGLIGGYARMLHNFSTAEQTFATALKLCDLLEDERLKTANLIRLAHLHQWQHQYDLSESLLERVIVKCSSSPQLELYLDFAYQHLGKCKFDRAEYEAAQNYFNKAIKLRLQKGDRQLIYSTQLALDVVKRRVDKSLN